MRRALPLLLALACASPLRARPAAGALRPGPTRPAALRAEVPPAPTPGCYRSSHPAAGPGWLMSSATQRRFLLRLPEGAPPDRPMPLVINLHGLTETPHMQELLTDMTPAAGRRGWAVVYPQGMSFSWNAGSCCGRAYNEHVDDVRFVRDLVEALGQRHCLDRNRIWATGMSNGGLLSYRLACEASDLVAAVAPVAAAEAVERCEPGRPVPVLAIHGLRDFVVPYAGGAWKFPSAPESVERWARRDGCAGPAQPSFASGEAACRTWPRCARGSEVTFCTVAGGGHTWPGGAYVPWLGHTTSDLDATEAILDFFAAHPMPAPEPTRVAETRSLQGR